MTCRRREKDKQKAWNMAHEAQRDAQSMQKELFDVKNKMHNIRSDLLRLVRHINNVESPTLTVHSFRRHNLVCTNYKDQAAGGGGAAADEGGKFSAAAAATPTSTAAATATSSRRGNDDDNNGRKRVMGSDSGGKDGAREQRKRVRPTAASSDEDNEEEEEKQGSDGDGCKEGRHRQPSLHQPGLYMGGMYAKPRAFVAANFLKQGAVSTNGKSNK